MPSKVTPEQAALLILDIFIHEFEGRPEKTVNFEAFTGAWQKRELPDNAFARGVDFAARAGWVDVLEARASYRLTKAGCERTLPLKNLSRA